MSPLPTVLALRNAWVHIGIFDGSDETSDVEVMIYNVLCQRTTLEIPDVQPDHRCYGILWTLIFFFFFYLFSLILYFFYFEFIFLFIDDEEAHDTAVT